MTWIGSVRLHLLRNGTKKIDDVVESDQVAVLVISALPVLLVRDFDVVWKRVGFGEVNQPAACVLSVVKEE